MTGMIEVTLYGKKKYLVFCKLSGKDYRFWNYSRVLILVRPFTFYMALVTLVDSSKPWFSTLIKL